jgi:hypothetical protein
MKLVKVNVAITGSRHIANKELVYFILKTVIRDYKLNPVSLKSGGANGVDKIAEGFFQEFYGIEPEVLKPDYDKYPPAMRWKAPLDRNGDVVEGVDVVIAIWGGEEYGGKKGGTRDACEKALAQNIPVIFVNVKRATTQYLEFGQSKEMFL